MGVVLLQYVLLYTNGFHNLLVGGGGGGEITGLEKKPEVAALCHPPNKCPVKRRVCDTDKHFDKTHISTGVVIFDELESNLSLSNIQTFARLSEHQHPCDQP